MEAAHETALAKGEVGIKEREPAPTLTAFALRFGISADRSIGANPMTKPSSVIRGGV
jgi:hypothetical protein